MTDFKPFRKYEMNFIKIGICRYCSKSNPVSKFETCIDCKTDIMATKSKRKREKRKTDPVRLAAYNKARNKQKKERLIRMKAEEPKRYSEFHERKGKRKRESKRHKKLAENKQVLINLSRIIKREPEE